MKKEIKKFEIINHSSRKQFTIGPGKNWIYTYKIEFDLQDNDKTLKIFISDSNKNYALHKNKETLKKINDALKKEK